MDGLPLALMLVDGPGGQVRRLNQAFVNLFGYSREEVSGESDWWRLAYPDPAARLEARQAWEAMVGPCSGEEPSTPGLDTRVTCKDTSTRFVRMALLRFGTDQVISFTDQGGHRSAGEPPQFIGVVHATTEQNKLEARLRESEETFRTYIEQSQDVIFSLDTQGRFLFASPAWERHFGFPVSEILGRPFAPFVHPDDTAPCMEYLLRVLDSGKPETSPPYRVRTATGEWRWFVANGSALPWRDGSLRFIGVGRDITENKAIGEALRESEARFRGLLQGIESVAVQGYSADGTIHYWNKASERFYGYAAEEATGRNLLDLIIPPDLRGEVRAAIADMASTGRPITPDELPLMRKDGSRIVVYSSHASVQVPGREPELFCLDVDLTDRKRAEEALALSQAELKAIYDHSPVMMCVVGGDYQVLYSNPALQAFIGPSPERLGEGRPGSVLHCIHALRHPEGCGHTAHCEACPLGRALEDTLRTGATYQNIDVQATMMRDGEPREVALLASTSLFQAGGQKRLLLCLNDITERIEAEKALKISEARYRDQFDMASEGIYTLTPEGELIEVNASSARMHGYTIQEMQGLKQGDLEATESAGMAPRRMHRLLAGEPVTYETEHRHKDGHLFPVEVSASLISEGGASRILVFNRDISARRRTEQALLESESRFRSYVENAPIGVFLCDETGRYLQVNQAASDITGYSREELLNLSIPDLVPEEWQAFAMGSFQGLVETGHTVTEVGFKHKDGHTGHWRVEAVRLAGDRFLGFTLDITERRQAEESLRESEARLRIIFEASEAGIILVSPTGEIQFANGRMAEMFGLALPQLIGTHYPDHLHPSEKLTGDVRMRMLIDGVIPMVSLERRYVRADGTDFWGHLSGRRLENPDGSLRALVGIVTDISKRREAEEEQRSLQAQLHQAQKMESLGALAGGVAHDMNNVLGAILGLASAHIESQPQGSPSRQAFGTIIKAAERGGNLLKSLLSFARQSSSEVQNLDLNAVLREEVRLLERTTLSKVRLVLELAEDLRPIRGDAGALTHAFMNLCVNAVDAMPNNGTLTLRTRNLGRGWVEVQVQDTGTGMTKEVRERALDPFFTTKDVGKGTGLGLPMVYSTVKTYQGEMELRSEPGMGTCVVLRFPACEAAQRGKEVSGANRIMTSRGSLSVLLVDDDELIQNSMLGMLEMLGHVPTLAVSGEEALARLEAGLRPDVIILDMNMPGLGGAGTLPRIRASHPTLPVLLATGRADQTAQELIHTHRYVTLISKPFGMKELQAYLDAFAG